MWIYANLWVINDVLTLKNVLLLLSSIVTTVVGLKSQNSQFKIFQFINFKAHKK